MWSRAIGLNSPRYRPITAVVTTVAVEAQCAQQERRLQRVHDLLSATPIAGRYWISCGVLLGWAREERLLANDALDVDFHYLDEDSARLEESLPTLVAAGFRIAWRFPNFNADTVATQWTLMQGNSKFDFFRIENLGDRFRRYGYGGLDSDESGPTENELALPPQALEEFHFLGRYWLKPANHDVELTALYGDWLTPDPSFSSMDYRAIVERRPWNVGSSRVDSDGDADCAEPGE